MCLFDLHCDTISECLKKGKSIIKNDLHIDVSRENGFDKWIQTFALWLEDSYRGEVAYSHFINQYKLLCDEIQQNSDMINWYRSGDDRGARCRAVVAVEGGHVLGGQIGRVEQLRQMNVAYLTLVWNSANELGSGTGIYGNANGLTSFGKDAVRELERNEIIVDVSHLNESGFKDVARLATRPFIASHSNAWERCKHPRNLKDYQIKSLVEVGGLCGVNLYPLFVNGKGDYEYDDVIRHIEHMLELGGEHVLAIGTDFDGAPMPSRINGIQTLYSVYEYMLKWYDKDFLDKLFYKNANEFFKKNVYL